MTTLIDKLFADVDIRKQYKQYETLILLFCLGIGAVNLLTGFLNRLSFTHPLYQSVINDLTHTQFTYNNYLFGLGIIDGITLLSWLLVIVFGISDIVGQSSKQKRNSVDKYMYFATSLSIYTFVIQIIYLSITIRFLFFELDKFISHFSIFYFLFFAFISTIFSLFLLFLLLFNGGEDIVD